MLRELRGSPHPLVPSKHTRRVNPLSIKRIPVSSAGNTLTGSADERAGPFRHGASSFADESARTEFAFT
jgi:hypothetical protein